MMKTTTTEAPNRKCFISNEDYELPGPKEKEKGEEKNDVNRQQQCYRRLSSPTLLALKRYPSPEEVEVAESTPSARPLLSQSWAKRMTLSKRSLIEEADMNDDDDEEQSQSQRNFLEFCTTNWFFRQ